MSLQSLIKARIVRGLRLLAPKVQYSPAQEASITNEFHRLYYEDGKPASWLGTPVLKCPLDLWTYQEIIHERKPDAIIETGTYRGGTARYLAHVLGLAQARPGWIVVSIDKEERKELPHHPSVLYVTGNSTDAQIISTVRRLINHAEAVMVILDSDHSEHHVSAELEVYSQFVTKGQYLIVEDTNVNGHPVWPSHGPGPMEAVQKFLARHHQFRADLTRQKFLMTFNPNGYLERL